MKQVPVSRVHMMLKAGGVKKLGRKMDASEVSKPCDETDASISMLVCWREGEGNGWGGREGGGRQEGGRRRRQPGALINY